MEAGGWAWRRGGLLLTPRFSEVVDATGGLRNRFSGFSVPWKTAEAVKGIPIAFGHTTEVVC